MINGRTGKVNSKVVNRLMLVFIGLLLIGTLTGANLISRFLSSQASTLVSLKAKRQALSSEQSSLVVAKKEVAKYSKLEQITQSIVPQEKDQAVTVRQIVSIASQSNITLSSIVFPTSDLGTLSRAPTVSLSQLTPVKGITGIYSLPIVVEDSQQTGAVSYSAFYNFLSKLEQNRRTSQVTGLTIQPEANTGLITFSLTINVYIKPR